MKIKKTPIEIFDEYNSGCQYNNGVNLYKNVEKNQRFWLGDQWYGVKAPDLTKPVFNIIKRIVSYFVAMIVSDNVGVHITPFEETDQQNATAHIISRQVEAVLERTRTKEKARTNVKNACVDGDTAVYISFDPDIETNKNYKGDIDTEIVDNTHVIFGNPYSSDVQKQPYILVVQRLFVDQVKDMAEEYGVSKSEIDNITEDDDDYGNNMERDVGNKALCTVITKFWKEKRKVTKNDPTIPNMTIDTTETTVHCIKCTQKVVLKQETDLGYSRYPIAWFSWEHAKNSYHGRSPVTEIIPNQVYINKIYAMCMVYSTNMGFPRVFYDQNKIAKLTNDVSKATAITNMDMAGKVIDAVQAPDFSNQVIQLIDSTVSYTKDFMGASDAALGNITNPNNTSAIVAVQQASSVPLEIQRLDYYDFFESIVRSIIDIMGVTYGVRQVKITESEAAALGAIDHFEMVDPLGNPAQPIGVDPTTLQPIYPNGTQQKPVYKTVADIDFSSLAKMNYDLDVEIGQSSYWSETAQAQTADTMFQNRMLTKLQYLKMIPDGYIPNKQELMDEFKQEEDQANQQAILQQMMTMQPQPAPNEEETTPKMADGQDDRFKADGENAQALSDVVQESKKLYNPKPGGNQ